MKLFKSKSIIISLLLLIFCFTFCKKNKEEKIPEKQLVTYYPKHTFRDSIQEKWKDKRLTYMDIYYVHKGEEYPTGEEIDFTDLAEPEKEEFIAHTLSSQKNGFLHRNQIQIIQPKGERKLIVSKSKEIGFTEDDGRDSSFDSLEKLDVLPTFPSCDKNDKECFLKGVEKHFFKHFNKKIITELNLPKGNLNIKLGFTVNNNGFIVYAAADAPKRPLVLELVRVINLLPKMQPAELNGEKVAVKYTIPITILVE
ncbi:hypothetical protein [Polaribacter sp. Hel_I_88]|uniref:hypothetical protein n=1 Tax=Polaribacter sp. Hel_I_88 TaxID=1250006 RepID=UPI000AB5CE44|nr:hypothetical protein [Polaribacter sp. Hel_I_88]